MTAVDFSRARIVHKRWKTNLKKFINGEKTLTNEEAFYHESCELGRWIYSDGMINYNRIAEMRKVEKLHARLHTRVRELMEMKASDNEFGIKRNWAKIEKLSGEIIALLTVLETKSKQQKS